ncbi:hypothetical protein GS982_01605 [Rhodococcus hoagii]|uniref:MazG-like nucleotide pyrophosphohydrolase n=1 Tax=Rhodococcus hoagii TaxID=43767 RepID=A0A9Q4ZIP6_RHOHA|nr:hypothetical protein [Prescottella equi]NKT77293.1 hypothetical protein [Prescottella equi]NKZ81080.1 hypothetical protein [Prescottella equi]
MTTTAGEQTPDILTGTRLFMEAAGQLPSPGFADADIRTLRLSLLEEEFRELLDADEHDNMVEIADALLDIIVVAWGTILAYGSYDVKLTIPPLRRDSVWVTGIGEITRIMNDYRDGESDNDEWKISVNLYRLIRAAWRTLELYFDEKVALQCADEVTRSNLAKIVDGKVIKHPETGKVLKPEGWTAPNIAGALADYGWA